MWAENKLKVFNNLIRCISVLIVPFSCFSAFAQSIDFQLSETEGCFPFSLVITNTSDIDYTHAVINWDLGNGNTSSEPKQVKAIYNTPGTYQIKLTVDYNGQQTTVAKSIEVFEPPKVDFEADIRNGCVPLTVHFTDKSIVKNKIVQWLWNFGDGTGSMDRNPSTIYKSSSTNNVTLIAIDEKGCTSLEVKSKYITATKEPVVDFSFSDTSACAMPLNVKFTGDYSSDKVSVLWDFGNGETSKSKNPTATFGKAGIYQVSVVAENELDCKNTITKDIEVSADFDLDITSNAVSACVPFLYKYDISTNLNLTDYKWTIDGKISTTQKGDYLFTKPGEYEVLLETTGNGDCKITRTQKIIVNEKPDAKFTYDKEGDCTAPVDISFIAGGSGISSHIWNFGGGVSNSNQESPTIKFNDEGVYNVSHIVENKFGCRDTMSVDTAIIVGSPIVEVITNPDRGCIPFVAKVSVFKRGVGDIKNINWILPDGSTYSGLNVPDYPYYSDEIGFIYAHVEFEGACVSKDIVKELQGGQIKSFTPKLSPGTVCVKEAVKGEIQTPQEHVKYVWHFGDGGTLAGDKVAYEYTDIGIFQAYVIAEKNGCRDSVYIREVEVVEPKAIFNYKKECNVREYTFLNQSIGNTSSIWTFDDGTVLNTNDAAITHTFGQAGQYNVKLTVENNLTHCVDSVMKLIVVQDGNSDLSFDKKNVCKPYSLQLEIPSDTYSNASWTIDSTEIKGLGLEYLLDKAGQYNVELKATRKDGCIENYNFKELINVTAIKADFDFEPVGGCAPIDVQFKENSVAESSKIKSRNWDIAGFEQTSEQEPNYTFTENKDARIVLTVVNEFNCVDSMVKTIPIYEPKAEFVSSFNKICTDTKIVFFDSSKAVEPKYLWEISDGFTSSEKNPSKTFEQEGDYEVKLTIIDANNCKDSITKSSFITVEDLFYDFSGSPRVKSCPPLVTNFEIYPSNIQYNNIQWDFGDDNRSLDTNRSPVNIYSKSGVFDVTVYLEDYRGCKDTLVKNEYITVDGPRGDFTFSPKEGCFPVEVTFEPDVFGTQNISWDFGDGIVLKETDLSKKIVHIYDKPIFAIPKILLEDSVGCKVEAQNDSIKTYGTIVEFTTDQVGACNDDEITFTDLSRPNSLDSKIYRKWIFSNGVTSTDSIVNQKFNLDKTGIITAYLYIDSEKGCENKDSLPIKIYRYPELNLKQQLIICKGDSIILEADGAQYFKWNSSKFYVDTNKNYPKVSPSEDSWFRVVAYDTTACSVEDSIFVKVVEAFTANAEPDTIICEGSQIQLRTSVSEINSGEFKYQWFLDGQLVSNDSFPVFKPFEDAAYLLNISNGSCKEWNLPVFVGVSPKPEFHVYRDTVLARGQNMALKTVSEQKLTYRWSPDYQISCTNCPDPVVNPLITTEYKVIGVNQYDCQYEAKVNIEILDMCQSANINAPNIFTPNNDGNNDVFRPVFDNDFAKFKHLRVYNRYGEMVFSTTNPNLGWDGTYSNQPVNTGVYVYYLEYDCYDGNHNILKGNVTLMR